MELTTTAASSSSSSSSHQNMELTTTSTIVPKVETLEEILQADFGLLGFAQRVSDAIMDKIIASSDTVEDLTNGLKRLPSILTAEDIMKILNVIGQQAKDLEIHFHHERKSFGSLGCQCNVCRCHNVDERKAFKRLKERYEKKLSSLSHKLIQRKKAKEEEDRIALILPSGQETSHKRIRDVDQGIEVIDQLHKMLRIEEENKEILETFKIVDDDINQFLQLNNAELELCRHLEYKDRKLKDFNEFANKMIMNYYQENIESLKNMKNDLQSLHDDTMVNVSNINSVLNLTTNTATPTADCKSEIGQLLEKRVKDFISSLDNIITDHRIQTIWSLKERLDDHLKYDEQEFLQRYEIPYASYIAFRELSKDRKGILLTDDDFEEDGKEIGEDDSSIDWEEEEEEG
jgi:hypothetical protein